MRWVREADPFCAMFARRVRFWRYFQKSAIWLTRNDAFRRKCAFRVSETALAEDGTMLGDEDGYQLRASWAWWVVYAYAHQAPGGRTCTAFPSVSFIPMFRV